MKRKTTAPTYRTVAEYRKALDAAREVAMTNFENTWGTRNVSVVVNALRTTIPGSASPQAAVTAALAKVRSS